MQSQLALLLAVLSILFASRAVYAQTKGDESAVSLQRQLNQVNAEIDDLQRQTRIGKTMIGELDDAIKAVESFEATGELARRREELQKAAAAFQNERDAGRKRSKSRDVLAAIWAIDGTYTRLFSAVPLYGAIDRGPSSPEDVARKRM